MLGRGGLGADYQADKRIALILQDDPVPIRSDQPAVPEPLANVIHRSLPREPEERFADVKEMRQALLEFG